HVVSGPKGNPYLKEVVAMTWNVWAAIRVGFSRQPANLHTIKETKDETSNRFSHYQCSGATATRIRREDNHETNSSAGKERPRSRRPGRSLARALVRF